MSKMAAGSGPVGIVGSEQREREERASGQLRASEDGTDFKHLVRIDPDSVGITPKRREKRVKRRKRPKKRKEQPPHQILL